MIRALLLALALLSGPAHAARFDCLPQPKGAGIGLWTERIGAAGYVAWWCPRQTTPVTYRLNRLIWTLPRLDEQAALAFWSSTTLTQANAWLQAQGASCEDPRAPVAFLALCARVDEAAATRRP